MRFLNRSHLSNKARGFTPIELRLTILHRLMIPLVPGKFDCARCKQKGVHYNEHLERCKKMHVTTRDKNGEPLPDYQFRYMESRGRTHAIHRELKNMMKTHWRKIPDVTIGQREPFPSAFFALSRKALDELEGGDNAEVAEEIEAAAVEDREPNIANKLNTTRADILITTSFPGETQTDLLVDHSTSSIHVTSNILWASQKDGVVNKVEERKASHYAYWDHQGQIIPFGCDSNGNIGIKAIRLVDRLYSKWNVDKTHERVWESDVHRAQLKKRFLDSLSGVFARAQLKDIMLLGQFKRARVLRHFSNMRGKETPSGANVNNGRAAP